MLPEQQRLSPLERTNLVAYLDGELGDRESREIATKLTQSVTARRELEALEKTWELLDHLPRLEPSAEFTARTLTQAEVLQARDGRLFTLADSAARRLTQAAILLVSSVLTLAATYAAARWLWPDPTARLERDLSLAQHLDEYLDVGTFAYLSTLDQSPLFNEARPEFATGNAPWTAQENTRRLRAMPLAERRLLAGNLQQFDLLSPEQQQTVRAIDSAMARLPAADRGRLESLLRVYHLWLASLPQQKHDAIAKAGESDRLPMIEAYRQSAKKKKAAGRDRRQAEVSLLSSVGLFEAGHWLRGWFSLSEDEKAQVSKLAPAELKKELQKRSQAKGPAVKRPLPAEVGNARFKARLEQLRAANKKQLARNLEEALWLLDHEPPQIDPRRLAWFEAALPQWAARQFDPLTPDVARRRLQVLYRIVFPEGSEIPPPPAPSPSKTAPPAARPTRGRPTQPAADRPTVPF